MNKICRKAFNVEDYILTLYLAEENGAYSFGSSLRGKDSIEEVFTAGITDDYNTAKEIFEILCENMVFPKHIECVVDEMNV